MSWPRQFLRQHERNEQPAANADNEVVWELGTI